MMSRTLEGQGLEVVPAASFSGSTPQRTRTKSDRHNLSANVTILETWRKRRLVTCR
jgi:hypothetical protein